MKRSFFRPKCVYPEIICVHYRQYRSFLKYKRQNLFGDKLYEFVSVIHGKEKEQGYKVLYGQLTTLVDIIDKIIKELLDGNLSVRISKDCIFVTKKIRKEINTVIRMRDKEKQRIAVKDMVIELFLFRDMIFDEIRNCEENP